MGEYINADIGDTEIHTQGRGERAALVGHKGMETRDPEESHLQNHPSVCPETEPLTSEVCYGQRTSPYCHLVLDVSCPESAFLTAESCQSTCTSG